MCYTNINDNKRENVRKDFIRDDFPRKRKGLGKMIYVISDIHGCYRSYLKMLEKLGVRESDTVYVLGDTIDRGRNGIKVLQDMMMRPNIIPILGNHEYMAAHALDSLADAARAADLMPTPELKKKLIKWFSDSGASTLLAYRKLSPEEKREVLDYLSEFSLYEEVRAGGKDYLLMHAATTTGGREMSSYSPEELLFNHSLPEENPFPGKILVTGHTPTFLFGDQYRGKIVISENGDHICLDAGAGYGENLAAVCLNTGWQYYVSTKDDPALN